MGKIIQIVEDDDDIRFILGYILEDVGATIETFDCIEAFKTRRQNADLLILDVRLPDGNGIELSKCLKSSTTTSSIPVIIMSAHANGNLAILEGKADAFIEKPFDLDRFLLKVKSILSQNEKK